MDGLEAKLKEKNSGDKSSADLAVTGPAEDASSSSAAEPTDDNEPNPKRLAVDVSQQSEREDSSAVFSPGPTRYDCSTHSGMGQANAFSESSPPTIQPETLIDAYFARFHAKPFHILDESSVRQRLQLNQLPGYLVQATCAVSARYGSQAPCRSLGD